MPPAYLKCWLRDQASLTARLKACHADFSVMLQYSGPGRALPHEARALGLRPGQAVFVREVSLRLKQKAVVRARSVASWADVRRVWAQVPRLAQRPLGEALWLDHRIQRGALVQLALPWPLAQRWGRLPARHSCFSRQGARILVLEAFLPELECFA
jgi:chorismate lyase